MCYAYMQLISGEEELSCTCNKMDALEVVIVSELSQSQNNKCRVFSCVLRRLTDA